MNNTELKKKLLPIMEGLEPAALFDNDGKLIGYMEFAKADNHKELLKQKWDLIMAGEMNSEGFDIMMFNFGEAPNEFKGVDRILTKFKFQKYVDIPEDGLEV